MDGRFDVEHLTDSVCTHRRTGNHHGHKGSHHDGDEDLQEVLEEGCQCAHLHVTAVHALPAEPQHRSSGQVQDHADGGEHQDEQVADLDRNFGEVAVGLPEPLGLVRLAHEGTDHADADDLLAEHAVDGVDLLLHGAEQWHEPDDQVAHHSHEHRHGDPHEP